MKIQTLEFIRLQQRLKADLKGIDFLRSIIDSLDSRDETNNEDKTPMQLILEYVNEFETTINN
jgi:hypothetical protein